MERFYMLRNKDGALFAGFKPTSTFGKFEPVFVKPKKDASVKASVIHEDDIKESEQDLVGHGISVDRVQVG